MSQYTGSALRDLPASPGCEIRRPRFHLSDGQAERGRLREMKKKIYRLARRTLFRDDGLDEEKEEGVAATSLQ